MKHLLLIATAGLGLWLLLLAPAYWLLGPGGIVQSSVALAICLLPAIGTMAWAIYAGKNSPQMKLLVALAGSGIRLAATLGAGAFVYFRFPETFTTAFWALVVLYYSSLLALEVFLILRPSEDVSGNQPTASC